MPLLRDGKVVDDVWAFAEDGHEVSSGGCILVSLGRFLAEHDQLLARNQSIGVRLVNSDDPTLLAPHLDHLRMIEVQFPKYTDGRALSQAQLLRRRLGYKGEIRARGQVLRDQLRLMIRCGIDAMAIAEADAEGVYAASVSEFSEFYQPAADTSESIFVKRQKLRQSGAAE